MKIFSKTQKPSGGKLHMLFNPPYGERINREMDIDGFYKQIGDTLKQNYANTDAWLVTSNMEALKNLGLRPSRRIKVFNAKLESKFVKYEMYEGSKELSLIQTLRNKKSESLMIRFFYFL